MGNTQPGGTLPNKVGYHVLMVQAGSPASGILFPFWDVIVGSPQQIFDKEDSRLVDLFKAYVGKPISLLIYNLKTEKTREVTITPSNTWGGNGLVGISMRFCAFDHTLELVWRVLDVYVDSPASDAKLSSRTDYIIGSPDQIFSDAEDFFSHINTNMNKPVQYYVYSTISDDVRLVTIKPNKEWGGSGSLGCDVGYGYLHRIPIKALKSPAGSPKFQSSPHNTNSPPLSPPSITLPANNTPNLPNLSPTVITNIPPSSSIILTNEEDKSNNNIYPNNVASSTILSEQMEQVKL